MSAALLRQLLRAAGRGRTRAQREYAEVLADALMENGYEKLGTELARKLAHRRVAPARYPDTLVWTLEEIKRTLQPRSCLPSLAALERLFRAARAANGWGREYPVTNLARHCMQRFDHACKVQTIHDRDSALLDAAHHLDGRVIHILADTQRRRRRGGFLEASYLDLNGDPAHPTIVWDGPYKRWRVEPINATMLRWTVQYGPLDIGTAR